MRPLTSLASLTLLLAATPLGASLPQQAPDFSRFAALHQARTIPAEIRDEDRFRLAGNIHPALRSGKETGGLAGAFPMERMILALQMSPEAQLRLEELLKAQQDPASPYFHKWLTPEQFGQMFGPSEEDLGAVTGWLRKQGFRVDEVQPGHMSINFTGNAAQVQRAFRTAMRTYEVDGEARYGNAEDPSIPAALSGVVGGVVTMHNIPRESHQRGLRKLSDEEVRRIQGKGLDPNDTVGSTTHYMSPNDFKVFYGLSSLISGGTDGTGVTIGIVGRTNIATADVDTFRSDMGLSAKTPTVVLNGTDPGNLGGGEEGEALLDVEWSGAVARNATIKFVVSKTTTTDGVDLSAQYIVNNASTLGITVMSTSFGSCESAMGSTENTFYNNLWSQAASEGVTSFVSSGDAGAAGCDSASSTTATGGAGVNGLSSTPYNVCVGGTQFNEGASFSSYWNTSNSGTGYDSAKALPPEQAWNESSGQTDASGTAGKQLWATGGGVSSKYSKPSWQAGTGVPSDSARDVPDVALTAAGHDGYIFYKGSSGGGSAGLYVASGTSASSPAFAGIMALVVQHMSGTGQGNANYTLYKLARAQQSGGTAVFNDVTSGNNSVSGQTGYSCGTGYDQATGWGSVNAANLVSSWTTPDTTAPTVTASVGNVNGTIPLIATASDAGGISKVEFSIDGTYVGTSASTSSPYSYDWNSTTATDGNHTVTAKVYDTSYNTTTSTGFSFPVDNHAPTPGTPTATGTGGTITFTATPTDTVGVTNVEFFVDGVKKGNDSSSPYTLAFNSTTVTDGSHSLYIKAYDDAGNVGTSSTVSFSVDNTAPVPATPSESGSRGTITLSGSATDATGVTKIEFYIDGSLKGSDTSSPFSITYDSSQLSDGSHTLTIKAYDAAGNSATSSGATFSTDNTAPSVTTSESGTGGTITFSATASDNVGVSSVDFSVDGVQLGSDASSPYSITYDSSLLSDGSHSLTAKAYDAAGNTTTSASASFTVDNNAPTVSATESGTQGSIRFNATASDAVGVTYVKWYVDGVLKGADSSSPYVINFDSTTLTDGSHTLVAKAWDAVGHVTTSASVPFSVNNALPVVSASESGTNHIIHFSATATDSDGITYVKWYVDGVLKGADNASPYTISFDSTSLSDGNHTLVAKAWDAQGGVGESSPVSFYVNNTDVTAPVVSAVTATVGATTVHFTATATDDTGVTYVRWYVDGTLVGADNASPYAIDVALSKFTSGSHTVVAKAWDAVGHIGESTGVGFVVP